MAHKTIMNSIKYFFLLPALLMCYQINAQKTWSLQQCIDYALVHNLQLKTFENRTASRKESHKQAYRNLLPSISANSNYRIRYGRSIDDENRVTFNDNFSNQYAINTSIDIFQGFKKLNNIAATKFLYKAVKEETLQQKFLLAFRVLDAYYDVLFFKGLQKIAQEQVAISTNNTDLVKTQIKLGLKAGVDMYEAESVLMNDQLALANSKNSLQAAKLRLQQEMNIEFSETFTLNILLEKEIDSNFSKIINTKEVYASSLSMLPNINAQEYYIKASKKNVQIARGNLYPSLTFSAGYATSIFETNRDKDTGIMIPFKEQFNNNLSQFISFNLRIPIFNKWANRSQITQRKIDLNNSLNQFELQKQELFKTIQGLVLAHQANKEALKLSEKNEALRALAFKVSQKKYNKGLISILELNQSKNLYVKTQNEKLQNQLKLEINKKTLAFYSGISVFNTITQ